MRTELFQILITLLAFILILVIDEKFHVVKHAKNKMKSTTHFYVLTALIILSLDFILSLYFYKIYDIHPTGNSIHAFSTGLLFYLLFSKPKH